MTDEFPSRALDKIVIRAPDGLRDTLKDAAAENGRSLNAEIVQRLEWSLRPGGIDEAERAEFVRGVMGGLIEAIMLEADPLVGLQRFRAQLADPELFKVVGELVYRHTVERRHLDLKKLGNRAGKMDADK